MIHHGTSMLCELHEGVRIKNHSVSRMSFPEEIHNGMRFMAPRLSYACLLALL